MRSVLKRWRREEHQHQLVASTALIRQRKQQQEQEEDERRVLEVANALLEQEKEKQHVPQKKQQIVVSKSSSKKAYDSFADFESQFQFSSFSTCLSSTMYYVDPATPRSKKPITPSIQNKPKTTLALAKRALSSSPSLSASTPELSPPSVNKQQNQSQSVSLRDFHSKPQETKKERQEESSKFKTITKKQEARRKSREVEGKYLSNLSVDEDDSEDDSEDDNEDGQTNLLSEYKKRKAHEHMTAPSSVSNSAFLRKETGSYNNKMQEVETTITIVKADEEDGGEASGRPSQALLAMRKRNLVQHTFSKLLLDALMRKPSEPLEKLKAIILEKSPSLPNPRSRPVGWNGCFDKSRDELGFISTSDKVLECTVNYLLSKGADPNVKDDDGNCPLLLAVQYRSGAGLVRQLLEKGAHVNQPLEPEVGHISSALDVALRLGQKACLVELLRKGGLPTENGHKFGCEEDSSGLQPMDELQECLLTYARANDFAPLAQQCLQRALWTAVEEGDIDVIRSVVKHGISTNIRDEHGRTPLWRAVESRADFVVIQTLLSCGAYANCVDETLTPPAVFPIMRNSTQASAVLSLLLQYGADPLHLVPTCYSANASSSASVNVPALSSENVLLCEDNRLAEADGSESPQLPTLLQFARQWAVRSDMVEMLEKHAA